MAYPPWSQWPRTDQTGNAAIILTIRKLPDIPSTTQLKWLERRAATLRTRNVRLMLVGVDEQTLQVFERSGFLE
jgi:SulP family sulfate permease